MIATGTKAGAVDADFSNDTTLELWELKLDDAEQGVELKAVATVSVESRYMANCMLCSSKLTKSASGSTILLGASLPSSTRGV